MTLGGSMVALATPMDEAGAVDYAALNRLVDFHLERGSDALVPVGTTGESATLGIDEHHAVIRRVVARAAGRVPVIAGTGANATAEAIELTRYAQQAGADACLLVTPYYNRPTQQGLYEHYRAIAAAASIPQILYNVPSRTACDLLPETAARSRPSANPSSASRRRWVTRNGSGNCARAAARTSCSSAATTPPRARPCCWAAPA